MAQLSDLVAQEIMGEINELVKRIEFTSEKIPQTEKLQDAVNCVLQDFRTTASIMVLGETARMKAELTQCAVDVALAAAQDISRIHKAKWISGSITLTFLSFSIFGWIMEQRGHERGLSEGHEKGYLESKDEKAAANWANTAEGKVAFGLAQAGSIRRLAACDGEGWTIKNDSCIPKPTAKNVVYGWKIKP
ncbi:hypothetical protein [Sapientia aquatica]|uniref:Replication protein n=1 Tax=Sapientia aquatica TaxID=1549640 RepID=A0A4R5VTB5_9BURK|nr:hypothetical protein [Sapientia aquatica]TDK61218.1 hypothetical protein E2I14_17690 [Sapientia aquatica]